jgi:phage baseplate assembly protein V
MKGMFMNNVQIGTIKEFKYIPSGDGQKLMVKVFTDGRTTNWLPVKTHASSFLKEHIPVRKEDQVIVINPFGNNEDGFVDRNLAYKDISFPNDVTENTHYKEFEDGTIYVHDTKNKKINLTTPCSVDINTTQNITVTTTKDMSLTSENINLTAKNNIKIKAKNTDFDESGSVTHGGTSIDNTHDHTQKAGNHFGAGGVTTPPNAS